MSKKIIVITIISFALFFSFANANEYFETNDVSGYKLIIEDDALLLSDDEINQLVKDMQPLTEYGNIIFKSINENSMSASSYARDYYNSRYGRNSGTIFLVDMDNRMIYIFSNGFNYTVITNNKAEIITDNVYRYATNKEYYLCASKAYEQIGTLLAGGKILEPMKYTSNAVIAIVVAFFANFIFIIAYSKTKGADNKEILKDCDIDFSAQFLKAEKIRQRAVYSPQSDSSSSGFSSGRRRPVVVGGGRWRWRPVAVEAGGHSF